jgi:hypothetical protein
MRSLVRLFAVALVGMITFGSMVKAAEAPVNPQNPSVSPLSEAYRASKKVLVLPVEVVPKGVPKDKTKRCPQWERHFAEFGLPVETFSYIAWRESRCNPLAHNKTLNRNKSQDLRFSADQLQLGYGHSQTMCFTTRRFVGTV